MKQTRSTGEMAETNLTSIWNLGGVNSSYSQSLRHELHAKHTLFHYSSNPNKILKALTAQSLVLQGKLESNFFQALAIKNYGPSLASTAQPIPSQGTVKTAWPHGEVRKNMEEPLTVLDPFSKPFRTKSNL